jgi:hypothetical protein
MLTESVEAEGVTRKEGLTLSLQMDPDPEPPSPPTLRRELGFVDGICFIISIMIGSGIFASPGVTLDRAGSPGTNNNNSSSDLT